MSKMIVEIKEVKNCWYCDYHYATPRGSASPSCVSLVCNKLDRVISNTESFFSPDPPIPDDCPLDEYIEGDER